MVASRSECRSKDYSSSRAERSASGGHGMAVTDAVRMVSAARAGQPAKYTCATVAGET